MEAIQFLSKPSTSWSEHTTCMVRSEQVHVAVTEKKHEKWKQYVDENPGVDSLSDLVRTAVEVHIASETDDETQEGGNPIAEELDTIRGLLRELEDEIKLVRSEQIDEPEVRMAMDEMLHEYLKE